MSQTYQFHCLVRIRVFETKTDGSRATGDVDDTRRLGRFLQQLCKSCDGDGGSNSVGDQSRSELLSHGLCAGRVRSVVFEFAAYGGVVDQGVKTFTLSISMKSKVD
jgi:hypothetical protein